MKKIVRLTESDLARIVKRVIRENRLLNEQADPGWIAILRKDAMDHIEPITFKVKPGSKLVTQSTYAASNKEQRSILILPKGTTFTATPSGVFMMAKGYTVPSDNFGYNDPKRPGEAFMNGLKDSVYMAKVAAGQGKNSIGEPLKPIQHNVLFTPHSEAVFVDGFMGGFGLHWPNNNLINALMKLESRS